MWNSTSNQEQSNNLPMIKIDHKEIITRKRAKDFGLNKYFTGKICKYGHIDYRYVTCSLCCTCSKISSAIQAKKVSPELNRKRAREWQLRNPERSSSRKKQWQISNKEAIRLDKKQKYQLNKEKIDARIKAWCIDNPDKKAAHGRNRKARKNNATGSHTAEEVASLFVKQNERCANCFCQVSIQRKKKNTFHVDHVIPLVKGGTNYISNIQLLCRHCNCSKCDKDPLQWAQENGRLL